MIEFNDADGKNYAAFRPCGCFCAVAHVQPGDKQMAKEVSKWIAEGLDVRQVTTEEVRNSKGKWGCPFCKPPKTDKQEGLFEIPDA